MPRVSFDKLRTLLAKSPPARTYYVHGSEAILKDAAVAAIVERAIDPATRDFNLDILSAQQVGPDELAAACSTLPMMADYRVVVLRDIEAWKRKSKAKQPAVAYLQRPSPETVLVMVQGNDDDADADLATHCTDVACVALSPDQLNAWLDQQLAAQDVALTADARDHLLRATAGELGPLIAEIRKLSGLTVTGPIDAETVGAMVGVRFGETADDWRDALLLGDHARALRVLPRLLELSGVSGVTLVSLLGTSLLLVKWARETMQQRQLSRSALAEAVKRQVLFPLRLRVGSYDALSTLTARVVGEWSEQRIRAALRAALDADVALKSSTISDENGIMTDLILTLSTAQQRRAA
jgi:DNA polymerase-3 subunit delta